jgi:hypothetical protein
VSGQEEKQQDKEYQVGGIPPILEEKIQQGHAQRRSNEKHNQGQQSLVRINLTKVLKEWGKYYVENKQEWKEYKAFHTVIIPFLRFESFYLPLSHRALIIPLFFPVLWYFL